MKDHRWESLDAADESFVDDVLHAGREELPDEARMRALEGRLGSALEKEPPPSGWWSTSRLYPVVGLAVVALGVRAGSSLLSSTPSPAVAPAPPAAHAATERSSGVEPASPGEAPAASTPGVSVESLPSADPPASQVAKASEAKARPGTAVTSAAATAAANGAGDELAVLEQASRALDATPEKALALTDEHLRRFRAPKFAQERERLAIVALVRLGRREEAKRRADAFEAAFPGSAHLTRVRELVRP